MDSLLLEFSLEGCIQLSFRGFNLISGMITGFGSGRNNGDILSRRPSSGGGEPFTSEASGKPIYDSGSCESCRTSAHRNPFRRECSWTLLFLLAIDLLTIVLFVIMLSDHSEHFLGKIHGEKFTGPSRNIELFKFEEYFSRLDRKEGKVKRP